VQVPWPRVAWACGALLALAVTEWVVWTSAETVSISVTATTMGTGLLSGLAVTLVAQTLALLGFGFLTRRWKLPAVCGRLSSKSAELWLVLTVTAVGLVVRCAALQEVPFGLWFDTAENGNQAVRMLHDPGYRPVFIAEATQLPALFVYFDAIAVNWLGQDALAVRLPSALFGAATVPAVWWLGRVLGGPALGIVAAFALATSRWHIDFSRLAIASIVAPFALAVALAATIEALRATSPRRRIVFSALLGMAISLGVWSYPASALIVPAVAAGTAGWVVHGGRTLLSRRLKRSAAVLLVGAAACVISLAPLLGAAVKDPGLVLQRSQTVAVSGQSAVHDVFESAIQHVLMFTVRGDRNGRHNTPGRPEMGFFAPFFLAGIGAALLRRGSAISLAVPGAIFLLAGGIFTLPFEAPQSHRAILAVVPASLLVALPIALVWSRQRTTALVLGTLLVGAGAVESADYFRAQLDEPSVYLENSILETEAGRWLRGLEPNVAVLASERFRTHPTVRFLSGEHPTIARPGTAESEFLPLDARQSVAVLDSFDERAPFDRARALYSDAPLQTFSGPLGQGDPLVFAMFVSKQAQDQTLGFLAETPSGTVLRVPTIDASDARAWSATMRLLRSGEYLVDGGGSNVAIDGETVVSPERPSAQMFLARGAHALRVTRQGGAPPPQLRVALSSAAPSPPGDSASDTGDDPLFFALPAPGGLLFTWQIEGKPPQALVDSAPHRGFEGTFSEGHPWTAQWSGRLRVDRPGEYGFHVEAISTAIVFIDERPILGVSPGASTAEILTPLEPGWHALRVEYTDRDPYARLIMTWRPPGDEGFSTIPDAVLLPALHFP
jgi:hypothetical protein